jgi:hypothetical protein
VASGLLSRVDRYGAHNSSRKSALSALYLAPDRRRSEPCMTVCPSVVHTHHLQARPRFFRITSKTGNWSGIAIVSRSRGFHICVVPSRRRFKIHREGRKKLNRTGNAWIGFMSLPSAAPSLYATARTAPSIFPGADRSRSADPTPGSRLNQP